jgi:hypothetical protein
MTDKTFAFKFVVPAIVVVALGIMVSPSAVKYFAPIDQANADHAAASPQKAGLTGPQFSRVRLLVSTMK